MEEERGTFCDPHPQIPVAWDDAASILCFVQLLFEKPSYTYISSYCFGSFSVLQITLLCSTVEDSHVPPAKTFTYSSLTVKRNVEEAVEHLMKRLKKIRDFGTRTHLNQGL